MTDIQGKKLARSAAKRAVTAAARKLTFSISCDADMETLKYFMLELEKAYDEFCTQNEEFEELVIDESNAKHRVVNGEDISTYRMNVNKVYQVAKDEFIEMKITNQLKSVVIRDIARLKELLTDIQENLHSSLCPDWKTLEDDQNMIQTVIRDIEAGMTRLNSAHVPSDQVIDCQQEADKVIESAYKIKREVKQYYRELQSVTTSKPVSSTQGVQYVMSSTLTKPVSSTLGAQSVMSSTLTKPVSSTQGAQSVMSSTLTKPVSSTQGAQSVMSSTLTKPVSSTQGVQHVMSSTFSVSKPASSTQGVHHVMSSTSLATKPAFSTQGSQHLMFSPSSVPESVSSTHRAQERAEENYPSLLHSQHQSMYAPPSGAFNASTPMNYSFPTTFVTGTWGNPIASPIFSQAQNAYATESHDVNRGSWPANSQNFISPDVYESPDQRRREMTMISPRVQIKKIPLPVFTGHRKDWPEFRAVWKELAEGAFHNKTALAHELKRSLRGEAAQRVKSVYVTKPEAYDIMWKKLEAHYSDISASVQAALEDLHKLKPVAEEDYKGLIELVDTVESSYSQLEEQSQINTLTMRDIDFVNGLLPTHLKVEWNRRYRDLSSEEKIQPFHAFMKFLDQEREAIARLAETQTKRKKNVDLPARTVERGRSQAHHNAGSSQTKKQFYQCAYHKKDTIKHRTCDCREFQKLPIEGRGSKCEHLRQVNACFICFGDHQKKNCPNKLPCAKCGKDDHHVLLCKTDNQKQEFQSNHVGHETSTHASLGTTPALYGILQAKVFESGKTVTVFCDNGSNTTYITHQAAERIKAKRKKRITLDVTTMGNVERTYDTRQYEFTIITCTGKKVPIVAYGMDRITGPVNKLNTKVLSELFPEYDPEALQRKSTYVDILLGCDYYGLHPKHEESRYGDNLSVMRGDLGICLQGTHTDLVETTKYDSNLAKTIHDEKLYADANHTRLDIHPEINIGQTATTEMDEVHLADCYFTLRSPYCKKKEAQVDRFIQGEELGTEVSPRCGGCRCSKCPAVGHTYSFKEEQELKMIQENLTYDEYNKCWKTSYPWLVDPRTLPNNYNIALATLKNTERTLMKDRQWAQTYDDQMKDMVERNVARKPTKEELREWSGPVYYISHLAVLNPKSNSTPVRIVFNSSQVCQGTSLNASLAKGPDCYLNNLLGILLRWREGHTALVGDIRKMFNSIHLEQLEQHCHRFLWRNLNTDRDPDVYVMTRVNMGDTPAPAISTEAVYKTAERFQSDCPRAADLLKRSTYVDDLIDSCLNKAEAVDLAREVESMLEKGGFKVKCWQLSGEPIPCTFKSQLGATEDFTDKQEDSGDTVLEDRCSLLKGTDENVRVLGVAWKPESDKLVYEVTLNFSKRRKGARLEPNLVEADLPEAVPHVLSRRTVLSQLMALYDPLGFVCPFTLIGKVYLRETWSRKLGWDDPLPSDLHAKWKQYFTTLFQLESITLSRCLKPDDAIGKPWLVLLSDGSDLAYGFAAYIRWQLLSGDYWCRLIMAKCRIAPMNKLSTPQMELNAAVLSKRGRKIIEREMRFDFERVLQIVDSETVLNMINKTSTRFKVYEGVRVGEIQAATDGDVSCWAWMSGKHNTADWLTRGRNPKELNEDSYWWNGPAILSKPVEEWGLKFGLQKDCTLPGEKKMCSSSTVSTQQPLINYQRYSNINKVIWVVARLQNIARQKSFSGGRAELVTPQRLQEAEDFIVKDVQKSLQDELHKTSRGNAKGGRYAKLKPSADKGIWVVGERLSRHNAMTPDSTLQKLLPACHRVTRLMMERAHRNGHRGRDATLALFRTRYWVPHGSKLAKSVKQNCQLCKLREAKFLEQEMGPLPEQRLKPSPAFNQVMIDLFGPYTVRGEVQKRTSGKAYGVIFTDMVMRAVHIEAVLGYDTKSFLLAVSRFASVRGWPAEIYSDPGSQLVGASKELDDAWKNIDRSELHRNGTSNGSTWIFGPADSPWYQGAVESLVKSAKRAIHFAVANQRLSPTEFLTVCYEVSNLINERPIGTKPSTDSTLNILTPNSLLLGRSRAANPLGWQPSGQSIRNRYHVVQAITDDFWKRWTELYAPTLLVQRKWHTSTRNLQPDDVVIVADRNTLRGDYRLGRVKEVYPSKDGKVRRVSLVYKNYKVGEDVRKYRGAKDVIVTRAVQRLALLAPAHSQAEEKFKEQIKEQ